MKGRNTSETAIEVASLIVVPIVLGLCAAFQFAQTAAVTLVVAVAALLVFFSGFERTQPALRQIMPIAVLAAFAVAGRVLFAPYPDVKPVSAICIVAGVVFGRRSGFMVGALAALVSNFFFGQGPFTPWQMYAWGLIGYLSGVFADAGWLKRRTVVLVWGFASGLVYGFILNSWFIVGFVQPLTWESALAAYAAGLAFDSVHAVATVGFLLAIYVPWCRKLERIKLKFAFV